MEKTKKKTEEIKIKATYTIMHISPEIAEQFKSTAKINRLTQSELLQVLLVYAQNLKISVGEPTSDINLQLNRTNQKIKKLTMDAEKPYFL